MYRTNDPIADFNSWDSDREEELEKLPRCVYCKEPIQQEDAVRTNEGWICDVCLNDMREEIIQEW